MDTVHVKTDVDFERCNLTLLKCHAWTVGCLTEICGQVMMRQKVLFERTELDLLVLFLPFPYCSERPAC